MSEFYDDDPELEALRVARARRTRLIAFVVAFALIAATIAGLLLSLFGGPDEVPYDDGPLVIDAAGSPNGGSGLSGATARNPSRYPWAL